MMVTKTSLRATIANMDLGEKLVVSIGDYSATTIRNYAAMLGLQYLRTYSVHINRDARAIEITRTL